MKSLFIVTLISDPLIDLVISKSNANDIALVSPYQETISFFQELGIDGFLLQQKSMNTSKMDRVFAQEMLPGKMSEYGNLGNENLPVWKVLSLDRLKFWFDYSADINSSFINGISADEVYVSLDLDSPYPWIYEFDVPTTAIQVSSIRTQEFYFMSKIMDFDKYIVLSEEEKQFLENLNLRGKIKNIGGKTRHGKKIIESHEREDLKKSAGFEGDVTGIIFDKRDEWQARKYVTENSLIPLIFPIDKRSAELLSSIFHGYKYFAQINNVLIDMCDTLVAFRWDDNYFDKEIPDNFTIVDYNGINLAKKLAPEWIEVSK